MVAGSRAPTRDELGDPAVIHKLIETFLEQLPERQGRIAAGIAEGDLDFRGTLAVDKTAPVGFREIRLAFALDTDAGEEQLATLMKLTERYCVVYQTLRNPPAIAVVRTG